MKHVPGIVLVKPQWRQKTTPGTVLLHYFSYLCFICR